MLNLFRTLEQALFPRTQRCRAPQQRKALLRGGAEAPSHTRLAQTVADMIFDHPELGLELVI